MIRLEAAGVKALGAPPGGAGPRPNGGRRQVFSPASGQVDVERWLPMLQPGTMLRLLPVVEAEPCGANFEWAPERRSGWLELGPHSTDEDVAAVVATLAAYNRVAASGPLDKVVAALEAAELLVLPGGLLVRAEGLDIWPGCCCGLEGWRDWMGLAPGGTSPWMGHDPTPSVECKADGAIIWPDSDRAAHAPRASVGYAQIEEACRSAAADLAGFTSRLADWLSIHAPAGTALAGRFAEWFDVSGQRPLGGAGAPV